MQKLRSRARAKRGINVGYIRTCTYAFRQRHTRRMAITAGNFARNFAVIQFGHDLLGMKPNSKAAAAFPRSADLILLLSPLLSLSLFHRWLDFLCYTLNEPFALLLAVGSIDLEANKARPNIIRYQRVTITLPTSRFKTTRISLHPSTRVSRRRG